MSGVVGAINSRHGVVLPNSIANLQKGERSVNVIIFCEIILTKILRYINSDFVFLSAFRNCHIQHIKVSYNIACQWKINLYRRCREMNAEYMRHLESTTIDFSIPKFHLPAHGPKCHSIYSLNFRPGWVMTDGEGIERLWASTNTIATMTREMSPGHRHDFLDDLWGAANFRKQVGLGKFWTALISRRLT